MPLENNRADNTLRTQTQSILRNAILNGLFKSGQKLVERELCILTGASRSILRESLAQLQSSGLLKHQSYKGYSVTQLNTQEIYEIFELRSSVETLAAELFTERASLQEINELTSALTNLEASHADYDLQRMRLAKEAYYAVLFTGCRNNEIRRALENVTDRVDYLRSQLMIDPERRETSLEELRRLTKALTDRDRITAKSASIAHIESARDAIIKQIFEERSKTT